MFVIRCNRGGRPVFRAELHTAEREIALAVAKMLLNRMPVEDGFAWRLDEEKATSREIWQVGW